MKQIFRYFDPTDELYEKSEITRQQLGEILPMFNPIHKYIFNPRSADHRYINKNEYIKLEDFLYNKDGTYTIVYTSYRFNLFNIHPRRQCTYNVKYIPTTAKIFKEINKNHPYWIYHTLRSTYKTLKTKKLPVWVEIAKYYRDKVISKTN